MIRLPQLFNSAAAFKPGNVSPMEVPVCARLVFGCVLTNNVLRRRMIVGSRWAIENTLATTDFRAFRQVQREVQLTPSLDQNSTSGVQVTTSAFCVLIPH